MSMDNDYQVEFTPTFREYLRFNFHVLFCRFRWLVVFSLLSLAGFLAYPFLASEGRQSFLALYRTALPGLILPGITFILSPVLTFFSARQRWGAANELREFKRFRFSDHGIEVEGETFRGSSSWANIATVERARLQILLGTFQGSFYLIPTRAFPSGREASRFWEFLRLQVSKGHAKSPS
jgi:hypothetical protein